MFLRLGLGQLGRALERVADAARRRAVVAVEARPDAVVAVQVDAPGVAPARIGVRVRAVVRHVPPLRGEVVEAVVRAVRVVRRDQEDVGVLDDLLGRRVGRVVAHEPLGGLERDRRSAPTRGRGRCAWISTPGLVPSRYLPIRSARIVYGPRGTSPAGAPVRFWSRKSVSDDRRRRRLHDARARRWCGTGARGRSGPASRASIAAATCAAVLASAPAAFLASSTRIALRSSTSTASGRSAPGRLTNSTVMPLPPSWPQAAELTTTADWPGRRRSSPAPCAGSRWSCSAASTISAMSGYCCGDLLEARVELLRVLVVVDEVRTCSSGSPSAASTSLEPVGDRCRRRRRTPAMLDVTRIWFGRVMSTLNRLRWNMYSPESTNRAHRARRDERACPRPCRSRASSPTTGSSARPRSCAPRRRGSPAPWS